MCGIVGYIGSRQATPILVRGLKRLEYRGYDSAGVAVWDGSGTHVVRCQGKLSALEQKLETDPAPGSLGIGHTRWATHGRPSDQNAHPHRVGSISVVHNGIIENHLALRQELSEGGAKFTSETDTEIFAHLIHREKTARGGDITLTDAVRSAIRKVKGAYAIVVMCDDETGSLVAAKNASPMVMGLGEGENFIASDITAILDETRRMVFIDEEEIVTLTRDGARIIDFDGKEVKREPKTITWSAMQAEKGGFRHFMLKEIHEQPRAVADTLAGRVDVENHDALLDGVDLDVTSLKRVIMIACGTSYHAAMVGEFLIEEMARIPVEVDLASEFRYRNPIVGPGDLIIAISQSGETADTMAAIREAKSKGAKVMAISNVLDSSIPRLADYAFYTHAGPEIGVASTKAFVTQLVALVLVAIHMGRRTGALAEERARELLAELLAIPNKMVDVVGQAAQLQVMARRYGHAIGFLFLGRGNQFPIALEGALKLKEISYIHAEGYAAGEMKHGPIALIDENLPVVVLVPRGPSYDKVIANMEEVKARQGKVLAVASRGDVDIGTHADDVVLIPDTVPELQPLLTTVPLQLLAYYVADYKGTDIDQPRNLAKSVTVE
ncbi:glutamine--fructose-6-phosphate transaminase (isomerizing) [Haliangium sp.]|uniref:glutamine--fructose-6-phosphate transaminase (isomerizing) n=1 Tax=Haliangium sp. TaxID=2663208 RepID=UPI003D0C3EFD